MKYGEIAIIKARRVDPFPENDWAQRKLNGALSRRRAMEDAQCISSDDPVGI